MPQVSSITPESDPPPNGTFSRLGSFWNSDMSLNPRRSDEYINLWGRFCVVSYYGV